MIFDAVMKLIARKSIEGFESTHKTLHVLDSGASATVMTISTHREA